MQMNTLIKVGSLAFDVVQDEKIRQLATMVHHGARRRGLIGQVPGPSAQAQSAEHAPPKATPAPSKTVGKSASTGKAFGRIPFEPNPGEPLPWQSGGPIFGVPVGKYFTGGSSKKALHYAQALGKLLIK